MKKINKETEKKAKEKCSCGCEDEEADECCDCGCESNKEEESCCSCGCESSKEESCCGWDAHKYEHKNFHHKCGAGSGCIYGLGLVGSAVYFIGQATNFSQGLVGFLKALVWPALMVYEAFKFLMK